MMPSQRDRGRAGCVSDTHDVRHAAYYRKMYEEALRVKRAMYFNAWGKPMDDGRLVRDRVSPRRYRVLPTFAGCFRLRLDIQCPFCGSLSQRYPWMHPFRGILCESCLAVLDRDGYAYYLDRWTND